MSGSRTPISVTLTFDPDEMAMRGRIGAFVKHSRHNPKESTEPARAAFNARFERQVDPNNLLDAEERARRADCAKRAYFARLALASAKARRKPKPSSAPAVPALT